jgi:hypothetical protein
MARSSHLTRPGWIEINPEALARYKMDVGIKVKGRTIFSTPSI